MGFVVEHGEITGEVQDVSKLLIGAATVELLNVGENDARLEHPLRCRPGLEHVQAEVIDEVRVLTRKKVEVVKNRLRT